jgi:hypothetical protein
MYLLVHSKKTRNVLEYITYMHLSITPLYEVQLDTVQYCRYLGYKRGYVPVRTHSPYCTYSYCTIVVIQAA